MDKIQIYSWFSPDILNKTNYNHGDVIDGDEAKALEIVSELFKSGLNVMIRRAGDRGTYIAVSDGSFGQR